MQRFGRRVAVALRDADWDFFLPDDDDAFVPEEDPSEPEPGDFWIEPSEGE